MISRDDCDEIMRENGKSTELFEILQIIIIHV